MPKLTRFHLLELATVLLVVTAALWLIPQFGTQHDEVLFAKPAFNSRLSHAVLMVGKKPLPLMMMSYLGALKVYVYKLVFGIFPANLWSLRLPALIVLLSAALLLRNALRQLGYTVAGVAFFSLFLVSPSVIITGVFDWGPVCLQFLFFGGLVYFLARATGGRQLKWFALAGLFFGLGVWEKLTFAMAFTPSALLLFCAAVWQFPRKKWITAAAAFLFASLIGMSPFLIAASLNKEPAASRLQVEKDAFGMKYATFSHSVAGTVLIGYFTSRDEYIDAIASPLPTFWARTTERVLAISDFDRWILLGLILLTACIPGRTHLMRGLLLTTFATSWLAMASFHNLGASGHHTVLLHPLLLMAFALAVDDAWPVARWRYVAGSMAALLALINCASLSDIVMRVKYLPVPIVWSPAISSAAVAVAKTRPTLVYVDDWGLENSLVLFSKGRIQPFGTTYWLAEADSFDREWAAKAVTEAGAIFVGFEIGRASCRERV